MEKYLERVSNYYSTDKKMYHNIYHVIDLYFLLDCYEKFFLAQYPDLNIEDLKEAIAWHDAYYVPGSLTNEEDSVELYLKNGYRNKTVIDAILSTKIGNTEFKNGLEKVLHDLDWNGFRSYPIMMMNEDKILYEATYNDRYSVKVVKENQIKFYKSINAESLYMTDAFKIFNNEAKKNIERRLKGFK